jgi:thiol-disulfide isomerase/thioredoxin
LIIKGDAKLKNVKLFEHQSTFPSDLVIGVNKIRFENYPNAGYLLLSHSSKSSFKYLPMIWVSSDTSTVELTIDTEYNVVIVKESEPQIELNHIFESSNKFSLFPYEPSADRPLEPIMVLEAKALIQNLKVYTKRETLVSLLELSKERNINNWSTDIIKSYLEEPTDLIYNERKLLKIFGLDSLGNPIQVAINKEKFLLLAVSGSWCGPCVKGIPNVKKSYNELNPKIEFVHLWNDSRLKTFTDLHREKKKLITWPSIWDRYGLMANSLLVNTYPTYILFDQTGMEVKRWEGKFPNNLEDSVHN